MVSRRFALLRGRRPVPGPFLRRPSIAALCGSRPRLPISPPAYETTNESGHRHRFAHTEAATSELRRLKTSNNALREAEACGSRRAAQNYSTEKRSHQSAVEPKSVPGYAVVRARPALASSARCCACCTGRFRCCPAAHRRARSSGGLSSHVWYRRTPVVIAIKECRSCFQWLMPNSSTSSATPGFGSRTGSGLAFSAAAVVLARATFDWW